MNTIKVRRLTIRGVLVRCPGRGAGDIPRDLTLMPNGAAVTATCGQKHRGAEGGKSAQCFFPVELTAAHLKMLAEGQPGAVRLTLPSGVKVEGTLVAVGERTSTASRAAAAARGRKGKGAAPAGPAMPAGRATGGALSAAFGAIAAVASATGQVADAGASAVGSVSDLGREGIGAARDGIREAGAYGQRRHERKMNKE